MGPGKRAIGQGIRKSVKTAVLDGPTIEPHEPFAALASRYRGMVVRIAFKMTRDVEEAEDIAQDVFLRLFERMHLNEFDDRFTGWLFVVARNASLDAVRRRRRGPKIVPLVTEMPDPSAIEENIIRTEQRTDVRSAVDLLPTTYRDTLTLYYFYGLRYREIAEKLEMPIGTVKTNMARAKRRLRKDRNVIDLRRNS